MARRSFSFMLAWRYLNPRRAMLSVVAMISVIGVMLGVLALVVVMSVYSGMEREVKNRFLGFIPHIRLEYAPGGLYQGLADWRTMAKEVEQFDGVAEAGPVVQDSMMMDVEGRRLYGTFQGIDTESEAAVQGLKAMLDLDAYPESSADMGIDDRVVISSRIAGQFGIGVGDSINLLTMRNLEEVERVFGKTKEPPLREAYAQQLEEIRTRVDASWKVTAEGSQLSTDDWNAISEPLVEMLNSGPREAEEEVVYNALTLLDAADNDEANRVQKLGADSPAQFLKILDELKTTDVEKMDAAALKNIEQFVLPKEAVVVGVYATSQMAMTPDVFMPLHLAQELAGLGDQVQGIGIRLNDPYQAREVSQRLADGIQEPGWYLQPWMDVEVMKNFSVLIEQQRIMMYFVLSFIVLVSAFSMTAVMFTVTIQKRREIGVMKALGAAPGQIIRVFVYQGMVLGAFGAVIGIAVGLLVIQVREQLQMVLRGIGFDPFRADLTGFTTLPAHVNPSEVVVIGLVAFLLCAMAAWLPAFFASRSDAARSLRNL
ncbi:lipoprotein-releasing system permease protein [Haloferula luteola]|uniref:Lipoprotein-releasing system permease protein n=1 Tax=Haloferula luteola TaxID=595692 RepID=A0A840V853_9BACT|nr:FtsX-like permease family protein [Haloferula luteola]MBB5350130.1 lipoprotein-releasing system permease protein [Haloferula luteola]